MKKNAIFGLGAAIMLALFGCANSPIQSETESLDPISSSAQAEEEAPKEKTVSLTTTVKAAGDIYEDEVATLRYRACETTRFMGTSENASVLDLDDTLFGISGNKNGANNRPGLNRTGIIRLYDDKSGDREGSSLDVSIDSSHTIKNIAIDFGSGGEYASVYNPDISEEDPISLTGEVYLINGTGFTIKNTGPVSAQVDINSVTITFAGPAKMIAEGMSTQLSLSYTYLKELSGAIDSFDREATGVTGTSYGDWEVSCSSGVTYIGNSAGGSSSIQLKGSNPSGIVSSANTNNHEARKVVVSWNAKTGDGRTIDIYGKNEAYSGPSDLYSAGTRGTKIGSLSYDTSKGINDTELIISDPYKYIGIRSNDGTLYLSSIDIEWTTYTYSDVAIRFGSLMKKTVWDRVHEQSTIQGYGVMLSTSDHLATESKSIKDLFDDAFSDDVDDAITDICKGGNIKNYYTSLASKANPDLATDEQKGDLIGDYYIWNLYKGVSDANLLKSYDAVAYIRIEDEIVFLNEVATSVKGLVGVLLESGAYNEEPFYDSLNNLANLEEE